MSSNLFEFDEAGDLIIKETNYHTVHKVKLKREHLPLLIAEIKKQMTYNNIDGKADKKL